LLPGADGTSNWKTGRLCDEDLQNALTYPIVAPPKHFAQVFAHMSRHLVFILKRERAAHSDAVVVAEQAVVLAVYK